MRRSFRSPFDKKVILRGVREYDLPKIKTLRQILRGRRRDQPIKVRRKNLRRKSRVGSRRHFVEQGQREFANKSLRSVGERARPRAREVDRHGLVKKN